MHRAKQGFTLIEIMIVVAIIGILTAIAVPTFMSAREIVRRNACQENLSKIDSAKEQWAMENSVNLTEVPEWSDLVGNLGYIRKTPACPSLGEYTINSISEDPVCSMSTYEPRFRHQMPGGGS